MSLFRKPPRLVQMRHENTMAQSLAWRFRLALQWINDHPGTVQDPPRGEFVELLRDSGLIIEHISEPPHLPTYTISERGIDALIDMLAVCDGAETRLCYPAQKDKNGYYEICGGVYEVPMNETVSAVRVGGNLCMVVDNSGVEDLLRKTA